MKLEGSYKGIPIYSTPVCPPDTLYMINEKNMVIDYPKRKDGKPDMRYSINKLMKVLESRF